MKRKLEATAAILLCLILWLLCGPAKAGSYAVAVVNNPDPADRLNLRAEAKDGAASLGLYYTGVRVVVKNTGNTWWQVEIGSRKGYMQAKYLVPCGEQGDLDQSVLNQVGSTIPTARVGNQRPQDGLHLRNQPSTTAGSNFKFGNGTPVEIWGIVDGGDWYHVRVPEIDATGFMLAKFVIPDEPLRPVGGGGTTSKPSGGSLTGTYAVVNNALASEHLHLRTGTSTTSKSLGRYENGTTVEIRSEANGWCQVAVDNQTGYMQSKYLRKDSAIKRPITLDYGWLNERDETLRAAPWSSAKAVSVPGSRAIGTQLNILGQAGTWYYVEINGVRGFLPANTVLPETRQLPAGRSFGVVQNVRSYERLNLRARPATNAKELGKYFNGTQVEFLNHNVTQADLWEETWCEVRVDGKTGYMKTMYLKNVPVADPTIW